MSKYAKNMGQLSALGKLPNVCGEGRMFLRSQEIGVM